MQNLRVRQRGFTLAEILVTTAVFAIIMLAALAVYDESNKTFKTSTEAADMQQSTRIGFEKLISDVRMAGFDYSRGGTPVNSYQVAQPDEQIEYAGQTAIVFRANFNYNTATGTCAGPSSTAQSCGNGLEPAYEPVNVNGEPIFPYVTTNDDEIVAYVLRSADSTKNNSQIQMYLDSYKPREVFPNSLTPAPAGSNPSQKEKLVTITGIDTTNANPPYTLYRMTLTDVKNNQPGTPVAENIRSINFKYYTDAQGTTLLKDSNGNAITDGAIGGDGQYDPNAAGNVGAGTFNDRLQRALIQSIRVSLVGMNASPDLQGYTNPTETIASIKSYRQYSLTSLVVPRNLGKTGFPEPATDPPAPPQITGLCVGHCGAPVITWQPPTGGAPVLQYKIQWDTDPNFTNPHTFLVSDPNATTTVLPDDGIQDVSQTWSYRMASVNDNGQSAWSNGGGVWTAKPKNSTKPSAPSTLTATNVSINNNAQPDQVTLSWTSPTSNDPSASGLSCSGSGSGDGSTIPGGEIIKYRVWRGSRADFDPRSTCSGAPQCEGVQVLGITSGSQPSAGIPGSVVTWIDNTVNEQLPQGGQAPASCTQYYYRVQAVDRCGVSTSYETTGNVATSESDFFPPINGSNNAVLGEAADMGTTPNAPVGLQVDTTKSGCPDPVNGGQYCKIVLLWAPVTSDTAGNAIGVDTYRITRMVKHQNNLPSPTYSLDTTFGTNGTMDVPGFSQQAPDATTGKISWTDTTALVADPTPPFTGAQFSYEYTVAAKTCSKYSAESNAYDYPTACTINPVIIQAGASNFSSGTAGGDTPATAWVMNAGDTITVQPPAGVTFSSVKFDVSAYPTGTPVDSYTAGASPYVYAWKDQVDGQIYQVVITVTELTPTAGCQEIHIKYVQDQLPAACAFANVTIMPALSQTTSGSTTTASQAFVLTNNGTDNAEFFISGSFQSQVTQAWTGPTLTNPTLTASGYTYSPPNVSDNYALTTTPFTRSVPTTVPNIAPNGTLTLTVKWQYKKTETALTTTPLQKLCIAYQIPSEPGVTKFCNVVGQSATTNNPNSCD